MMQRFSLDWLAHVSQAAYKEYEIYARRAGQTLSDLDRELSRQAFASYQRAVTRYRAALVRKYTPEWE